MIYDTNHKSIRTAWQGQLSESLEAGEALTLELGVSNRVIDNIPTLVMLDAFAQQAGLLTPWLLVGGDGVTWAAAIHTAGNTAGQPVGVAPLYGGADVATYMAMLATLPGPSAHTRRQRTTGLPVALHTVLLPESQPGVPLSWSSLPFGIGAQSQPSVDAATGPIDPAQEHLAPWLALLVVIGLIVGAILV